MSTFDELLPPLEFIDEDELQTFEGWARFQAIEIASLTQAELAMWRGYFDDARKTGDAARRVGRMKLKPQPGEYRYAVAVRDGDALWLTLWIRRSPKPEFFVFQPRGDRDWNPHTSLHADGTLHSKSHDVKMLEPMKRQPPASIRGSEHLGAFGGHSPKSVGAVCDPHDFTAVFEVGPGVLGPRNGMVTVDLIEPGSRAKPLDHPAEEVDRRVFTDSVPNVLIRIFRS